MITITKPIKNLKQALSTAVVENHLHAVLSYPGHIEVYTAEEILPSRVGVPCVFGETADELAFKLKHVI